MGVLGAGMSTDGEYAQETVGQNMTDVTLKEKFILQHSTFSQSLYRRYVQLFEVKDATWNKSHSLSGSR